MREHRNAAGYAERDDDLDPPRRPLPSPGKITLTGRIMRKGSGAAASADRSWELIARAREGGGAALPGDLRSKFEGSLGAPLDGVRIHTGDAANDAAKALGARAFTVGNDVVFGKGQYDPSSAGGMHLIAHEVAHTVQQAGQPAPAPAHKDLEVSEPGDSAEREADAAADAMVAGEKVEIGASSDGAIARDPDPNAEPVGPKSGSISGDTFDPGEGAGGCDLHGPGCMGGHDVKVVADFSYVPVVYQTAFSGGSVGHDSVSGAGISMGSSVGRGGGIPGSAFGKATPKFEAKNMTWKLDGKTVTISGQVFVDVRWDVQSRGRIDIDKAEHVSIGPGNYMTAFYDLSGDLPRTAFWNQALTEKHELFHVKEYLDESKKETATAAAELSKKTIKVPMIFGKDAAIQDQVDPMVKDLAKTVGNNVLATFNSGGEGRAYGDGAAAYKKLADAIKARGEKMGWDKVGTNKNNPKQGLVPAEHLPTDNVPDSDKR